MRNEKSFRRSFERACLLRILAEADSDASDAESATVSFIPRKERVQRPIWRYFLLSILDQDAQRLKEVDIERALAATANRLSKDKENSKMEMTCSDAEYWRRKLQLFLHRHRSVIEDQGLSFKGTLSISLLSNLPLLIPTADVLQSAVQVYDNPGCKNYKDYGTVKDQLGKEAIEIGLP
jgi:hypothetical protein